MAGKKDKGANAGLAEGLLLQLQEQFKRAIADLDIEAAKQRVAALRAAHPGDDADAVVERLIRDKCLRTAAVGAAAAGASIVPGIGTFAALTVGVAADIGATFKLQAELVLEIAAARGYTLSGQEKQTAVMLITGVSGGANQLVGKAGNKALLNLTEHYAQRWIAHALPVVGVGATAAVNALSTYIVGKRADAYMKLGEQGLADWLAIWRALIGVDERAVGAWLAEGAQTSWTALRSGVADAASLAMSAGSAAGAALASGASAAAGYAASGAGAVAQAGRHAGGALVDVGSSALSKSGELAGAAGAGVVGAASATGQGVANAASTAGGAIAGGAARVRRRVGGLLKRRPAEAAAQARERGSPEAHEDDGQGLPTRDEEPLSNTNDIPREPGQSSDSSEPTP